MKTQEIRFIALNAQLGGEDKDQALLKIDRLVNFGKTQGYIEVQRKTKFRFNENKAKQRTENIKDDVEYMKKPTQDFYADLRGVHKWKNAKEIIECEGYTTEEKLSLIKRLLEMGELKC